MWGEVWARLGRWAGAPCYYLNQLVNPTWPTPPTQHHTASRPHACTCFVRFSHCFARSWCFTRFSPALRASLACSWTSPHPAPPPPTPRALTCFARFSRVFLDGWMPWKLWHSWRKASLGVRMRPCSSLRGQRVNGYHTSFQSGGLMSAEQAEGLLGGQDAAMLVPAGQAEVNGVNSSQ